MFTFFFDGVIKLLFWDKDPDIIKIEQTDILSVFAKKNTSIFTLSGPSLLLFLSHMRPAVLNNLSEKIVELVYNILQLWLFSRN